MASWAERVLFLWIQGVLSPFCLHPTGSWYFLATCDWWGIVVLEFIDLSFLTVYILFWTAGVVFFSYPTLFKSSIYTLFHPCEYVLDTGTLRRSDFRYACLASYPDCLPPAYLNILFPVLPPASGLPIYWPSGRVYRVRTEGRRTGRFLDHRTKARVGRLIMLAGSGG